MIEIDLSNMVNVATINELEIYAEKIALAHRSLLKSHDNGDNFTGWIDLPGIYHNEELNDINETAQFIQESSEILIVIGIGGSYLGSRAALEFILSPDYNHLAGKRFPEIYFAGNNLSSRSINKLISLTEGRDFSINVVSKSGETIETMIVFRIFKRLLEDKYGRDKAKKRIYITTNSRRGALLNLSITEGYQTLFIPENISGRYSVLTSVGLLPMAVAGIDIREVLRGAENGMEQFSLQKSINPVWGYVASRHILESKGKNIEVLAYSDPGAHYLGEWWKQLFSESEGKNKGGIFTSCIELPGDLHSIGQYIQEGKRNIFETAICLKDTAKQITFPDGDSIKEDGLGFLAGMDLHFIDIQVMIASLMAHAEGGTPSIILYCDQDNIHAFGELVYFFELSCAISCYLRGVNPFDQPGVEAYKENLFALLNKPGYEERRKELQERNIKLRR